MLVEIAHGNLLECDASTYVVGIYEEAAPTEAVLTLDRAINGKILALGQSGELDGRAGAIAPIDTGADSVKPDFVVLAGLGKIDGSRPRILRQVASNVVDHLSTSGAMSIATIALGLGSGYSAATVAAFYINGLIDSLRMRDGHNISKLIVCDYDADNCRELALELAGLAGVTVVQSTLASPRAERPAIDLVVRMGARIETEVSSVLCEASLSRPGVEPPIAVSKKVVPVEAIRSLVARFDGSSNVNFALGNALADLVLDESVVRALVEVQFREETAIVLHHDEVASTIPWEVLSFHSLPHLASRLPLSRRLLPPETTSAAPGKDVKLGVNDKLKILLIVDPTRDLSGAAKEGERIAAMLSTRGDVDLDILWQEEATRQRIVDALQSLRRDVVHYAGHAFFDPADPARSGLVCYGDAILTASDIHHLHSFPHLVFLNACESGRIRRGPSGSQLVDASPELRIERGIGLAQAFLRGGVRQFVGTYWPVGDMAAEVFSKEFYKRILRGESMGEAVMRARQAVWRTRSSDWADYIHYGDADGTLRAPARGSTKVSQPNPRPGLGRS